MAKKTTNKTEGEPKKPTFTTKRQESFENTLNLFRKLNDAWKVPPKLLVSDWADAYRRLSPESSAEAGRWRTSRAEYQREPMNAISDPIVKKVVLRFSSQTGKALDIDTPIPTPNGWATMRELKKGDIVFDENGEQCRVTFATEIMYDHKCYEITFSDGAKIVADAEHNWCVESDLSFRRGVHNGVLTTEEIFNTYKYGENSRNRYAIPVAKALNTEEKELLISPYVLGVWLGDGNSYSAQLTINKNDSEIIERVSKCTDHIILREHQSTWNVMLEPQEFCDYTMHKKLLRLNLLANKHIPKEYLRASREQRMELLRGIMDTDGSTDTRGRCEITLKSKILIYDVSELLNSLGIKHTVHEKTAKCQTANGEYSCTVYRITFTVYEETKVFYVKRKQDRINGRDGRRTTESERRRIVNVVEVKSRPVKCIGVDSPNHLYLAGREMIPTHNSECMNNILGYFMDYDPSPIMFLMPTEDVVKGYSQDRIAPMIRDTPVLSEKVVDAKSRDSGNTISYKKFIGGYVVFYGANAPAKLASRPIRVLLADEIDRFPMSAGEEGDPLKLAEVRQTTFWNKKTVVSSTPTIKGASKIDFEYEMSSQEVLHIACPHCGEYQPLVWANLKFRHFKEQETDKTGNKFELLGYACPYCGTIEGEVKWKKQMAHSIKWVAGNPDVKDIRGFHINALYSPWKKWESLVDDFLTAKKGGKEALKVFVNTMLAESWEDESDIDFNELLSKRRQYYNCVVPNDVVALTCGVDVQDNRLEYEIVGWSVGRISWGIQYGVIHGDPANDETWDKLSAVLFSQYERQDGVRLSIMATCIDSGGHKTEQVYKYCKVHFFQNVYAIKGQGGSGVPYVKIPKNPNEAGVFLFIIGVDVGKDTLYSRLKVDYEDKHGFCHFPMEANRGYDEEYFKGLTSETKKTRYSKGVATITWEKRVSNARNEPFDIRNYATAALEIKALGMPRDLLEFLHEEIGAMAQKTENFAINSGKNAAVTVEKAAKIERRTTNFASKSNGGIKL